MPNDRCDTCRFWLRYDYNDMTKGECRMKPPVYVKRHKVASKYPETKEDFFCNEWKVMN